MTGKRVKNSKKRGVLLKSGFFLYFGFCLFATVWLKAAVVNMEYEIGKLGDLHTGLIREREMGSAQRASFYSHEKIEKAAIKRLGMSLPERENVFFVKRTPAAAPFRASIK
jgi:hypothetical protein